MRGYFCLQEGVGVGGGTSIPGRCRSSSSGGRQPAGSGDAGTHQTPAPHTNRLIAAKITSINSAADPDPYVFGPPGSGSNSQRYGSGPSIIKQK